MGMKILLHNTADKYLRRLNAKDRERIEGIFRRPCQGTARMKLQSVDVFMSATDEAPGKCDAIAGMVKYFNERWYRDSVSYLVHRNSRDFAPGVAPFDGGRKALCDAFFGPRPIDRPEYHAILASLCSQGWIAHLLPVFMFIILQHNWRY